MRILAVLTLTVAVLALVIGVASLSNATSGVGGIAVACFLAIVARIFQASSYQDDFRKWNAAQAMSTTVPSAADLKIPPLP